MFLEDPEFLHIRDTKSIEICTTLCKNFRDSRSSCLAINLNENFVDYSINYLATYKIHSDAKLPKMLADSLYLRYLFFKEIRFLTIIKRLILFQFPTWRSVRCSLTLLGLNEVVESAASKEFLELSRLFHFL